MIFSLKLNAQYLELGVKSGIVLYDGDLNTSLLFTNLTNSRWSSSIFIKYNFKNYFAIQLNYLRGQLYGEDAKSLLKWQTTRNLSFKSHVNEYAILLEFHFKSKKRGFLKFNPYTFLGIGKFYFKPLTLYNDEWIPLQALGTEGQGLQGFQNKYKENSIAFPFGLGFKYAISKNIFLGLEISTRLTLTDYIDDIHGYYIDDTILRLGNGDLAANLANRSGEVLDSGRKDLTGINRGNKSNDSYYTTLFTLSYKFPNLKLKSFIHKRCVICPSY